MIVQILITLLNFHTILTVGSKVKISNVTSTENTTGIANSAFQRYIHSCWYLKCQHILVLLTLLLILEHSQIILLSRTTSLPTFQRVRASSFYVYDVEQIKEYKQGEQDGIYYLTVIDSSNTPSVAPFNDLIDFSFSQPIVNLYPQLDRDNPVSESPLKVLYNLI